MIITYTLTRTNLQRRTDGQTVFFEEGELPPDACIFFA